MEVLTLLILISVIISLATGTIGVMAFIELRAFMRSTHKVEYVPFEPVSIPLKKEPLRDQDLNEYDL